MYPIFGQRRHYGMLLMRGLFGAAAMQSFYVALVKLPLADAVTLFFFSPAMTTVAAWLVLKEPLGLRGAAGVKVWMRQMWKGGGAHAPMRHCACCAEQGMLQVERKSATSLVSCPQLQAKLKRTQNFNAHKYV
eukprot:366494-Chlamydomonas_euryale.AAC.6